MVAQGLCNKAIARKLQVEECTVKHHLSDIFRALGANNRAHALILALRAGVFDLFDPRLG